MTRKDYAIIAGIIKMSMEQMLSDKVASNSAEAKLISKVVSQYILKNTILELTEHYDNFDLEKFMKAVRVAQWL